MSRTAFLAFVLAALPVSSANASPAPPAKTHTTASAAATTHRKNQHPTHARVERAAHYPATHPAGHPVARKPPASVRTRTTVAGPRQGARQGGSSEIRASKAAQSARTAEPHTPKAAPSPRDPERSANKTDSTSRGSAPSARKANDSFSKASPSVRPVVPVEQIAEKLDVSGESGGTRAAGAEADAGSTALAGRLRSGPDPKPTRIASGGRVSAAVEADEAAASAEAASIEIGSAYLAKLPITPLFEATVRDVSLRRIRLVMPPPLVGSHESLARQNEKSDAEGLERIEDEDDLADRITHKLLVPLPASTALTVNGNLPVNHRYCRPWTAVFLADLARSHDAEFHRPLEVSSAVRTVEYQKRLMGTNGNAAAAEGEIVSPHLTGATIDIAKNGLSRQEMAWMRTRLLALEQAGKIDVEEEFQQACFHITVYKNYVPPRPAQKAAQPRGGQAKTRPRISRSGAKGPDANGRGTDGQPTPDANAEIASRGR